MLCGLTRILSRIKLLWNQFYLWGWRNKYGYFECEHCCLGCEFFDICMDEFADRKIHPEEYANGEGYYQNNDPYMDEEGWLWVSDTEAYGGPLEEDKK